jgi:ATP-dependent protease HslVU (ClpYQ) peptidase subunit
MTVIIAVKNHEEGTVLMGADSQATYSYGLAMMLPTREGKLVDYSGFVLGSTGAIKIRNIIQAFDIKFAKEGPTKDFDLENALYQVVIPSIKEIATKHDLVFKKDGLMNIGGTVMVSFADQICVIFNDLSTMPIPGEYWAVGSGAQLALGSLYSTAEFGYSLRKRVQTALKAASTFQSTVGGPFVFKKTKPIK